MFNKAKNAPPENKSATLIATEPRSAPSLSSGNSARSSLSVIGSNTQVEGDINSDEDLTVEGRVSGIITCKQHTVTLGTNSRIKGDVYAHTLHVSGEVKGNLVVLHRATIHKGAQVSGAIVAPSLVLEDGSVFHGSIDMNPNNEILKTAFNDVSASAKQSSPLNNTDAAAPQKSTTNKPAATKNQAVQHDQTEV